MNSLPRERVDVETVGSLVFGVPVIFVYAIAQEDDAETLGEGGGRWDVGLGGQTQWGFPVRFSSRSAAPPFTR